LWLFFIEGVINVRFSLPWWIAVAALAIAVVFIIFTYRRTEKPLNWRLKLALIALRVISICLILFCLLEPTIIAREAIRRKANLLVLVDNSQSMSLTDAGDNATRIDAVREALITHKPSVLTELADRFDVQLYQFSSDASRVEEPTSKAEGTLTDMGKAISKVADEWKGQPTAGIVLITDGGNNSGEDPVEITQQTGLPIYTIGVGSTQTPRDIQIAKVDASPIAYQDHTLPVRAIIRSNGYDGREIRVSLMQDNELKDSVSLKLNSQSGDQIVNLQIKPQQEGTFSYTVSIPIAPDEITPRNNIYPFSVKDVKTKLKVLYIDGRPRWEYTFL